jgi:hypothetical protein
LYKNFTMLSLKPQYITDAKGNKLSVILTVKDFQALIEEFEDLYDQRLYDEAKADNEPSIPIDEAFKLLDVKRAA